MRVLVVGLGSMGKRRARLIKSLGHTVAGVDNLPARREEAAALGVRSYATLGGALRAGRFEAGFVCTAPLGHAAAINALLDADLPVFTELNLVADAYGPLTEKAAKKKLTLFISSTMLYRAETRFITRRVKAFGGPVNYVYHIGQYLPGWHPWESYKNFFVGDVRTGGVREIFGIELPWLVNCFGAARPVCVQADRISALEIGYPDSVFVTLRHQSGAKGALCVDVVCPKAVRSLEVYGEGLHLFWEGGPENLFEYDVALKEKKQVPVYTEFEQDARYSDTIVENAYLDEVVNFFEVLRGGARPRWSFERDLEVIALMDAIEGLAGEVRV
jgi:predicted dehydrogenase